VTSSIAHELNNPLAGILSATSVLKLEDFWDEDELEALEEIELTAKRCKKIIEIFLGFSRGTTFSDKDFQMQEVIEQALELIRYRSAELDIRLLLDFSTESTDIRCSQVSILTMVFYLIFSELLTLLNHEVLVEENSDIHSLNIKVDLTSTKIRLFLPMVSPQVLLQLKRFQQNSRLLKHLLTQSNNKFDINVEDLTMELIANISGEKI
jgi:nitrogen fixation/metabolism regulation signal transduction histidine kinase